VAFYEALGEGKSIKFAFEHGKSSMLSENSSKTDMLILKISELEQKILIQKEELKKQELRLSETQAELISEVTALQSMEKELLLSCKYPKITEWLLNNKSVLIKRAQKETFQGQKSIDVEIFTNELERHLDLVIKAFLFDDRSSLDEPDLNISYPVSFYSSAFNFLLNRIPISSFSKAELEQATEYILHLVSRI